VTPDQRVAYAVGQFRDPKAEITRLEQQAALLAAAEEAALHALGLTLTGRVLDIGCGPGFVAGRIQKGRPDLKIIGLDRDAAMVAGAREHIEVLAGHAENLPFSSDSFDGAYARLVLRHLNAPELVLRETHRVLRPGATAILIDSDDGALVLSPCPEPFRLALHARQESFRRRGADPFIGRRLSALLLAAGFVDLAVIGLVVDSVSLGRALFGRIVLSPVVDAIDQDLLSHEGVVSAIQAIDDWVANNEAFGMTTALAIRGRKGG
jgi:SAM-dependent methyltransferase